MRSFASYTFVAALLGATLTLGQIQTTTYHSRPDLTPIRFIVTREPNSTAYKDGLYFTGPYGPGVPQEAPVIYTPSGEVVWVGDEIGEAFDVRTQFLNGTEVLTLWHGFVSTSFPAGWGSGFALVYNQTYDLVYNLTASLPWLADIHEFTIPPVNERTALISSYYPLQTDLSSVGGSKEGWILNAYFQEIDVATNEVLFTWNASSHTKISDSYYPPPLLTTFNGSWDFFHINSVDKDAHGDYLISARHFHQLLKISGATGEVLWTLGGKNSSFAIGEGANFEWQHDARWADPNNLTSLTVFDNASDGAEIDELSARGLYLDIDYANNSVSLRHAYFPPVRVPSASQGSNRILPEGNVLVGYGATPWLSEFTIDGTRIFSAAFGVASLPDGLVQNYRAFKSSTWKGYPRTAPDISFTSTDIFVSWNGATEVATWEALVGDDAASLVSVANATRTGFETSISVKKAPEVVQVRAYNANGLLLGASAVLSSNGTMLGEGFSAGVPSA